MMKIPNDAVIEKEVRMLYRAGKRKNKNKEKQKQIGFQQKAWENNGLFEKCSDFPGFAFRVDKAEDAEVKFTGKVIMPLNLYQKMFLYTTNCTKEISGLGMVERVGNELRITDLFIVEQEVTTGNTTLNNKDLAQKTIDIINAGGDPSKMKLWWHSHTNGGMFWSVTDDNCCDAYNNDQWLLSMVVNYKKEMRCRLDIYSPIRITLDHMPVVIEEPVSHLSELEEQCKTEMKDKVKEASTSFRYGANATQEDKGTWKCAICSFMDKDSQIVVAHMVNAHNYDRAEAWQQAELLEPPEVEQPDENYNKDAPPEKVISDSTISGSLEDLYDREQDKTFHSLSFHDTFKIFWHWSIIEQKYYPIWGRKQLNREEYAFVAECLAQGVQVDKDLNAVS